MNTISQIQSDALAAITHPPIGPDAELLRNIEQFRAAQAANHAEFRAIDNLIKAKRKHQERFDAWSIEHGQLTRLEKWIARTPALTLEGARAKATLGADMLTSGGTDYVGEGLIQTDDATGCRMWSVAVCGIQDLLRLTGAAADAADADADLIALCDDFIANEVKISTVYGDESASDDDCDVAVNPLEQQRLTILQRMDAIGTATDVGLAARARALAAHSGPRPANKVSGYAFGFDPTDGTTTGRLLHMLLRDGAALAHAQMEKAP